MININSLNEAYLRYKERLAFLKNVESKLLMLKGEEINRDIADLLLIGSRGLCDGIEPTARIESLVDLINRLICYLKSIDDYEKHLLNEVESQVGQGESKTDLKSLIETSQHFNSGIEDYSSAYGVRIASSQDFYDEYIGLLKEYSIHIVELIQKIKKDAYELMKKDVIVIDDAFFEGGSDQLPRTLTVAKRSFNTRPCELLTDIGIQKNYDTVQLDLVNQGNMIIETAFDQKFEIGIDNFILAYVFKLLGSFPLGSINIHIFDKNPNKNNRRLHAVFKDDSLSELAQKTVTLYDYNSLSEFCDVVKVVRDDIFRKTNSKYPDLFSLYEVDQSDPFHFFILRDGLMESGGYSSNAILELINSMTKPGESGHLSGIRFLIVDDSKTRDSRISEEVGYLINSIYDHCSTHLLYRNKSFSFGKDVVEGLSVQGDIDDLVERLAKRVAEKITDIQKNSVSLEDVASEEERSSDESIIRIPVGISGNSTVQIPFSCKDERGTIDGQCIGYMVIGQSGSGKSSFFHSVVLNGCLLFSPDELQFWLLDFKFGGASSKYRKSQIPHVRIVAENNKIDDAICLFQMIRDEMEYRNRLIIRESFDNVIDYNKSVERGRRLPRIIILIDEVQEIFRDDNATEIQRMISSISVRMRSVGMHFVMVAQNLCEGKSYMLKDAFLPSATGRICFRIAENMPRDSGFGEAFIERRNEIASLSTGEAYVSWGKDTIKKVKMAYASSEDMNSVWFDRIKAKYSQYSNLTPKVIGSKKRLSLLANLQSSQTSYLEEFKCLHSRKLAFDVILGEDSYRLTPMKIPFSSHENSALLILGDDKNMASSICTSVALSLFRQKAKVYMFNADRVKIQSDDNVRQHPFMHLCSQVKTLDSNVSSHRLDEFPNIIHMLYKEFIDRQGIVQKNDDDNEPEFEDRFVVVNDLFGIESFVNNVELRDDGLPEKNNSVDNSFEFSIFDSIKESVSSNSFNESIQEALAKLLKNGYRYGIHVILAIKGDPSLWRNMRVTDVNRTILFNPTQFAGQVENQFYIREMLKNITNEYEDETLAVWTDKKLISKFRPIIYDMFLTEEEKTISAVLENGEV